MSKTKRAFASVKQLEQMIAYYFDPPEREQAEPPTVAGLAFYLGFNSRQEFEEYEAKGRYSSVLQRALLRIEATYEKKLHESSGGAQYALKNMCRTERNENRVAHKETDNVFQVEIVPSDLKPVSSEQEVVL